MDGWGAVCTGTTSSVEMNASGFAEDYLSALDRAGIDPDTARTQLSEGDTAAERPAVEQSPAPPRTMYSDGAEAARLAGLSRPRSVAEQLATRKPGGRKSRRAGKTGRPPAC